MPRLPKRTTPQPRCAYRVPEVQETLGVGRSKVYATAALDRWAANWSAIWYLLSAFAVISYTENAIYVLFAATGSWLGAFASVTWLGRGYAGDPEGRHNPP